MDEERIREILKENCIEAPEQSMRAIVAAIKDILREHDGLIADADGDVEHAAVVRAPE